MKKKCNMVCLNRGNSCFGVLAKGFIGNDVRRTDDNMLLSLQPLDSNVKDGGFIVFPSDTSVSLQDLMAFVNEARKTFKPQYVTIGRYLIRKYTARNGTLFDETSLSVELIGSSFGSLLAMAEVLCERLNQKCVLVRNNANGAVDYVEFLRFLQENNASLMIKGEE